MEHDTRARLEAFKAFRVKHPRLEEMDRDLMRAIDGHRSYTLMAVYGASGVGKSTVMKRVAQRCREEEPDPKVVPAVVVQASPEDIGASARLDYYRQVLDQLRSHVGVRDRVMNLALARRSERTSRDPAEWLDMREAVVYALELLRVKVVFVDEAQHLMYVDTPHKPTAQLDWLKSLTNRTNVLYVIYNLEQRGRLLNNLHYVYSELVSDVFFQKSRARLYIMHVLVGNFDLYDFCHLNAQAARRMRDHVFARYHLDNQTECEEFVGALRSLLERVPLTVDIPDLLRHWRWFGEWSLGCIGVLGDWLVETVDTLSKEGEAALTIEALTRHALQPDQRVRMEMEARTGEHKVERAKAQSALELERLLGKMPASAEANGATPQQPRAGAGTVGVSRIERAAMRDPVGETVQVATTSKCAFAGRVDIVPQRFLESGVSRVECPECRALRQITPGSGVLRFPSHDKRKTRSTQTERRWVRQSQGWEVISGRST